ncbi:MAG: ctpB 1 [Gemmataceae bacterium]|nr:ctpB 1 [Gemmataceae bacterium]
MTAWLTHRGFGIGTTLLVLVGLTRPLSAAEPFFSTPATNPTQWEAAAEPITATKPSSLTKPTPAQLRARATAAEKTGDWEMVFAAYCELHAADRTSPDVREKLNVALRRVQQVRRHRDPGFLQFVSALSTADAVNLFSEITSKVPGMFAEPVRATPQHLWTNGVEELERALGGAAFRQAFLSSNPPTDKVEAFRLNLRAFWAKRPVNDAREARAALKQLLAAAQDTFPIRYPAALAVEFVCGACSGLDEYTVFLTPAYTVEVIDTCSDLSVYGLYLAFHDGGLVVEGVAPGSWAAFHTSLRKGDRIARVNGRVVDTGGLADALRTPAGRFHEIDLPPPSKTESPHATVRLPVAVPTVYGDRIVNLDDGIGYVRVSEFHAGTPRELGDAIAKLKLQGMRALLLDLRGNRGGSFVAGVEVARRLLPAGLIVTTQGQLGQVAGQVFSSDSGMNAVDVPLVVMIDAETASAAEVVAAALRDNNRAVLVGMPTFGKGTIQYPLKLTAADDPDRPRGKSGTVRLTIAKLIAPRGSPINGVGVTPHVVEADPMRQWDVAVERALELLQPMVPRSPLPLSPNG